MFFSKFRQQAVTFLLLLLSALHCSAGQEDPCNNLPGNWQGKWRGSCVCDMKIEIDSYNEQARLVNHFTNCSKGCYDTTAVEYATCKNSVLTFPNDIDNAHGQIIGNKLTLNVGSAIALLNKQ